jgi:hypothetical protein
VPCPLPGRLDAHSDAHSSVAPQIRAVDLDGIAGIAAAENDVAALGPLHRLGRLPAAMEI